MYMYNLELVSLMYVYSHKLALNLSFPDVQRDLYMYIHVCTKCYCPVMIYSTHVYVHCIKYTHALVLQIIDQHLPDRKCSSFIQELSSRVVGLCVSRIQVCAANVDGTSAPVEREIPEDLVEQSDFECVLCTG